MKKNMRLFLILYLAGFGMGVLAGNLFLRKNRLSDKSAFCIPQFRPGSGSGSIFWRTFFSEGKAVFSGSSVWRDDTGNVSGGRRAFVGRIPGRKSCSPFPYAVGDPGAGDRYPLPFSTDPFLYSRLAALLLCSPADEQEINGRIKEDQRGL